MAEGQLLEIENLLNTATATLEERWEALDDDALAQEIVKYRSALTDVSKRLADLGTRLITRSHHACGIHNARAGQCAPAALQTPAQGNASPSLQGSTSTLSEKGRRRRGLGRAPTLMAWRAWTTLSAP